ncbi:MAG: hypothetical protein J7604_24880 [Sporocytophaga sp.]|uniref:hypothetical protein n=1 Tax=Sporocytophaga sp. TaxID=2231183 RepID=UPI001B149D0D|nr:hypothetical protein [Sporocytophaga sp.]MBO9703466.1 hypothetical protein [Sporocytophaga sp.]
MKSLKLSKFQTFLCLEEKLNQFDVVRFREEIYFLRNHNYYDVIMRDMTKGEFEKIFSEIAELNGFKSAFGGWVKKSNECIVTLNLLKPAYKDFYHFSIKVFVQGLTGKEYSLSDSLFKKDFSHLTLNGPREYNSLFDFDMSMNDKDRLCILRNLFSDFIMPVTEKVLSKSGIRELSKRGSIQLLPIVKAILG